METKPDTIALLDERVQALIGTLQSTLAANDELRKRCAALGSAGGEQKALREQNGKLAGQVAKLEAEIKSLAEKESHIKDRLQGIMKKIDAMEEALAGQGLEK